ncbi:MAG: hypothetical protein GY847_07315 [Proteobacteria bacterium]|nr:hypothetical protein [Pseudomonadota bacterium]
MPDTWTYVIEEPKRTELLTSYGVPEKVISLGSGDNLPDEVFDFYCNKPKHVFKNEQQDGSNLVVGIFESRYNESYACRKKDNELEYIYFNVKKPTEVTVLGDSDQCLLRALFDEIVDGEFHPRDLITRSAKTVDFQYLGDTFSFVFLEREQAIKGERKRDMKAYFERRLAYIRGEYKPSNVNPWV